VVVKVEAATASLDLRVALYPQGRKEAMEGPILLDLRFDLRADGLQGEIGLEGPIQSLSAEENIWLQAEAAYFLERAGAVADRPTQPIARVGCGEVRTASGEKQCC
jgi:hypothetical protein